MRSAALGVAHVLGGGRRVPGVPARAASTPDEGPAACACPDYPMAARKAAFPGQNQMARVDFRRRGSYALAG